MKLATSTVAIGGIIAASIVSVALSVFAVESMDEFIESTGTHVAVTNSEYIDVELTSIVPVHVRLWSSLEIIMLFIEQSSAAAATDIILSGFAPETTYYKYEDNFHHAAAFTTDEQGSYTYTQDLTKEHFLIIQSHKSTKFIKDDAVGGDCAAIGIWQPATKTCTLTGQVSETIQIDADGIILDGNGFSFAEACCGGVGVYVNGHHNVVVKNLIFRNISRGVTLINSNDATIANNSFFNTIVAAFLYASSDSMLTDNEILRGPSRSPGIGFDITFGSSRNTILRNNIAEKATGIWLYSGANENTVAYNTISASTFIGLRIYLSSRNKIFNNNLVANVNQVRLEFSSDNLFHLNAPVGGNYWSDFDSPAEGCLDQNTDGFCDAPYLFTGGADHSPWAVLITDPPDLPPEQVGASNVLFLPGFQGSRLYRQGALGEDELWVPTTNQDAEQLMLDDNGQSLDPGVYTRDIIDRTKFFFPIYEDFIEFMDNDMVGAGVINEWWAFPYDWRMSVDDIAALPELSQAVNGLAASSASGKVTIIAHSNGGLIAKLMLNNPAVASKVDRLIMVATPQLGTPETLTALLHGDGQNLLGGFLVRKSTARELGENMPGAYGLLPSGNYFDVVVDPVIQFTDEVKNNYDFRSLYGEAVDTFDELYSFLAGDNGARVEPAEDDTDAPNVLNGLLLNQASDLHDSSLDNWMPPEGVEVIQIAGWGLDTVYAIEYDDCDFCPFGQDLSNLDRDIEKTIDGDGTVVITSALTENFKKYFLNILEFNKDNFINRDHRNILEVEPIQDFLVKVLTNDLSVLPSYISETEPSVVPGDTRYRLRMKSPIAVHVYDSGGRHVGLIDNPNSDSGLEIYEEEIPNSSYFELGEKKYISLDSTDTYTVQLDSEGTGTFTFEIDEVEGDEVIETVAYSNIPVTPQLSGELVLDPESSSQPDLSLDFNGDGDNDAAVPANGSLSPGVSLELLRQAVSDTEAHRVVKAVILLRVGLVERFIERGRARVADVTLRNLDQFIEHMTDRRHGIVQEEALPLREMIAAVRETL